MPSPNLSNSNTPTGPFQTIVPALAIISVNVFAVSGPISKIISSAVTSLTGFNVADAVGENSVATTTSVGTGILPLLACASLVKRVASATKSASYNDLPTLWPSAAIKVLAMPPPTIS